MTPDLWRAPHLPLFLLAAVWAAFVPLVWLFPGLTEDPVAWHRQELVLGFAGAAMGGYLLTALPHWLTQAGRRTEGLLPGRRVIQALVLAWVAGRIAGAVPEKSLAVVAGLGLYPLGLSACLVVPLLAAKVWTRLPISLAPLLLGVIGLSLRLAADGLTAALGLALLVAAVGGRIVPAFLAARAMPGALPRRAGPTLVGRLADLLLALAWGAHLAGLSADRIGVLLLAAAAGQMLRMLAWPLVRGLAGGQVDLALLVISWLWLPLGLALVGLGLAFPKGPPFGMVLPTAIHALTMGLMGGMILAVMARATMRRARGTLRVGPWLGTAFALVQLAAVLRLGLPYHPETVGLSALCWSLGWAIVAAIAGGAVFRPVPHPVLSARRSTAATQEAGRGSRQLTIG